MAIIKAIIRLILFIAAVLLGLALLSSLIVLAAYGLGLLLNLLLHFQLFEAVLLSLLALGMVLMSIVYLLSSSLPVKSTSLGDDDDDDDDDWDDWDDEDEYEYEEDGDDEEEEISQPIIYPGIPRWRQPLKNVDFSNAKPDDRCPCGSGRKYKNCHGSKTAAH
jgi:hypothetical protein